MRADWRPAEGRESATRAPRTAPVGRCPICGGREVPILFHLADRLHGTPGEFTYRRCAVCRTVFQDPRVIPEDLPLCYPAEYCTHLPPATPDPGRPFARLRDDLASAVIAAVRRAASPGWVGRVGVWLARSRRLRRMALHYGVLDELNPRVAGDRTVLEVGCGTGALMTALSKIGWSVAGVEWDPRAAEVARRASGCPVWAGDFREIPLPTGAYDLVVLQHVIEHLGDPRPALARVAELLAPGGSALLVYPNPDSLGAGCFGEDWFSWDPPRHLVLPPPEAMLQCARDAGLAPIRVRAEARHALSILAMSRSYRSGRAAAAARPRIADRALALLEKALTRVGFRLGEEMVLVLANTR